MQDHSVLIPTSPLPALGDEFESKYLRNSDFAPKCPNMEKWPKIAPRPPKTDIFELFYFHLRKLKIWLPTSPQPALGDDFKSKYAQNSDFGPKCPNMEIWAKLAPRPPKMEIFEFFLFVSNKAQNLVSNKPSTSSRKRFWTELSAE